jgi:SAM-dependent methyltransferase
MGIDTHNLHFLAHAQDLGVRYARTLAIGRQALFVERDAVQALARRRGWPAGAAEASLAAVPGAPPYFEPLLQQGFGAREALSVDASAYEGASFVHDLNAPWPAEGPLAAQRGRFDAVLDFGCLEHVFDFPTAWRSLVDLCAVGGHLLHALPANNLCGHGFYQFSPELFFNLYRPERGFELRALYLALKSDGRHWWRVASPLALRRRVNLRHGHEAYLLVLARKLREPGALPPPQQSDYAEVEWQAGGAAPAARPSRLQAPLAALGLLHAARRWRERARSLGGVRLALPAPDYQRVAVDELLAAAGTAP